MSQKDREDEARYAEVKTWGENLKKGWDYNPKTGQTNNSDKFEEIVADIERLILADAKMILSGNLNATARLILAQLTHKHGLVIKNGKDISAM